VRPFDPANIEDVRSVFKESTEDRPDHDSFREVAKRDDLLKLEL
jgi:hypothetical protein